MEGSRGAQVVPSDELEDGPRGPECPWTAASSSWALAREGRTAQLSCSAATLDGLAGRVRVVGGAAGRARSEGAGRGASTPPALQLLGQDGSMVLCAVLQLASSASG